MPKTVVTSPQLMQPIAHFSHGVRVGTTIHLGAAAGVDRERRLVGAGAGVGDAGAQADQMFANLRLALGALGGDWSKVVKVKSYIVDWRDLAAYETVRSKALDAVQAATGTVGTWGFPLPQILLEAELVASLEPVERFGAASGEGGASARVGGLHFCTATPSPAGSGPVAPFDVQVAEVLRTLESTLERANLRPSDVVMVNLSIADVRNLPVFVGAFQRVFRPPFPALSVVGAPLAGAGQLIELESTATAGGGAAVSDGEPAALPASPGMLAGDWLFVSAMGDSAPDAGAQTRQAWQKIAAVAEAAGMGLEDVVRTNNVLTDWRDYAAFNAGYGQFVSRPYPPRATVHGQLAAPGARVQIEAILHRQGRHATVLEAQGR